MTQPDPKNDDDIQPLISRLSEEFGPRQEREPEPAYGEARPIPQQQTFQLRLPVGRPRAVWVLLALNIAIYALPRLLDLAGVALRAPADTRYIAEVGSGALVTPSDYIFILGAKINAAIAGGQYYRLLTAMFLHANLIHIAVNSYSLYAIGPETERIYRTPRFLALYFLSGLAGSVASYAFNPGNGVGASGAIFGLVGGLAAFYYLSRELLGEISRRQLGSLITVIMINLFIGLSSSGIDNFAHMGGLAGGALVGWLLAPRFEVDARLYPPQVVRRGLALAWPGALAFLALLALLVITISPPIR